MTPYLSNTEHREHGITLNGEDYIKLTFARTLETALAAAKERVGVLELAMKLTRDAAMTAGENARAERAYADERSALLIDCAKDRDALAEKLRRCEGERDEETRKLKEQFDLYCAETKRHNETWAQIHAATAYMDKECKNLPDGLMEKVREVFFRMTLVEMGRYKLRDKTVPALKSRLAALQQQVVEADKLAEALLQARDRLEHFRSKPPNEFFADLRCLNLIDSALAEYRASRQPDQRQGEGSA